MDDGKNEDEVSEFQVTSPFFVQKKSILETYILVTRQPTEPHWPVMLFVGTAVRCIHTVVKPLALNLQKLSEINADVNSAACNLNFTGSLSEITRLLI